mmetsp:Transcript_11062/g.27837  ORF Transcript_11062/g.27837 Transcript_11062/m.27837 type:complete len:173 (+) Transcript_11062:1581-2099(+)
MRVSRCHRPLAIHLARDQIAWQRHVNHPLRERRWLPETKRACHCTSCYCIVRLTALRCFDLAGVHREARRKMFEKLLTGRGAGLDFSRLASATEGYSGADVAQVAKEAAMRPLRRLMSQLEAGGAQRSGVEAKLGDISAEDIDGALRVTSSTASADSEKYDKFNKQFGQVLS